MFFQNCFEDKYEEFKKSQEGVSKMSVDEIRKIYYTQKGKEEGREEGKADLLIKQLRKKFNGLPENYEEKIRKLSKEKIESIATDIFDLEKIKDLERYF
ncbi:DUF4351 domain-containing protein [uncultured Clostridium sp.]|uniref:DUF4351 domain-containing protein n=1 Tax=uncultured Clostridium sp. TaxID=59620 RepID=UPI0025CC09E0|nr:DUF4351 domain-containing protein [uncultured Clostridium sp.]